MGTYTDKFNMLKDIARQQYIEPELYLPVDAFEFGVTDGSVTFDTHRCKRCQKVSTLGDYYL